MTVMQGAQHASAGMKNGVTNPVFLALRQRPYARPGSTPGH